MMLEATTARNGRNRLAPHFGGAEPAGRASWLLCRAGAIRAALPIEDVVETMRMLPLSQFENTPPYVLGLSIIRGVPAPVVDIGRIVNAEPGNAARLVTVRRPGTIIALAVDDVIGITAFAPDALAKLPALLQGTASETIAGVGALDVELLVFLSTSRLLPPDILARLDAGGAPS